MPHKNKQAAFFAAICGWVKADMPSKPKAYLRLLAAKCVILRWYNLAFFVFFYCTINLPIVSVCIFIFLHLQPPPVLSHSTCLYTVARRLAAPSGLPQYPRRFVPLSCRCHGNACNTTRFV